MSKDLYEQPSLNKYGTMKEFTHSTGGSGGDLSSKGPDTNVTIINDAKLIDDGNSTVRDRK